MAFFKLHQSQAFRCWGDYGSILCNGLCLNESTSEPLELGRTGPFVPPISFPCGSFAVVVTHTAKCKLESSGLVGIGNFSLVNVKKMVHIEWQSWEAKNALRGEQFPFNGEPEEYILHNQHDVELAKSVEPLLTWQPVKIGKVIRANGSMRIEGILGQQDVFRLNDGGFTRIIVNDVGRKCLSEMFGEWVSFEEVDTQITS